MKLLYLLEKYNELQQKKFNLLNSKIYRDDELMNIAININDIFEKLQKTFKYHQMDMEKEKKILKEDQQNYNVPEEKIIC